MMDSRVEEGQSSRSANIPTRSAERSSRISPKTVRQKRTRVSVSTQTKPPEQPEPAAKNARTKGKGKEKEPKESTTKPKSKPTKLKLKPNPRALIQQPLVDLGFDLVTIFQGLQIPCYRPADVEYERTIASSNLLYRFSRPACVVHPENATQVQDVIRYAKSQNVPVTVKGGGHSYSGASSADEGILMDMALMNRAHLSEDNMTMTVEGGALWGDAYRQLINGRLDGYVMNGGRCPMVGVAGFLLGGGLGPFGRSLGMGCDQVREITIVVADRTIVTVKKTYKRDSEKGKLFWALCGAGAGKPFGVVTEMKIRVCNLRGETVTGGRYTWFPKLAELDPDETDATKIRAKRAEAKEDERKLIDMMQTFYTATWKDKFTCDSTWISDTREANGALGIRYTTYYDSGTTAFQAQIDRLVKHEDLNRQLKRRCLPEKSTRFLHETLVVQWAEETKAAFPSDPSYRLFASFNLEMDPKILKKFTERVVKAHRSFKKEFGKEKDCLFYIAFISGGGQQIKKKDQTSCDPWRNKTTYYAYGMFEWKDKWLERDMRKFYQTVIDSLTPLAIDQKASFSNFAARDLAPDNYEEACYGDNAAELREIKKFWDPDYFFAHEQAVKHPEP
ncbi:hypothetical protein HYALB_00005368 [Hymenoscyphus albidus]|uniref:FAD-binding PCMH-type domain-containing protein n=1 Tax=Hymenoscyphus albidus TaxID=595503 RepID=A0A9N9Q2C5_9HELO|nr:hypothetical protein HYALB_00005368 [Hymenoscyphus albidus]